MPLPTRTIFEPLDLVNQALSAMGEVPIANLETDQTTSAIVMRQHYEVSIEAALTRATWRFATTKAALNLISAEPLNRWSAAWQLPANMLKVLHLWPPNDYEIQGSRLLTHARSRVELDYIRRVPEAEFPPFFTAYAVLRLAHATCIGITGQRTMLLDLRDDMASALNDALFQDAQQQPNVGITSNAFIDVRN